MNNTKSQYLGMIFAPFKNEEIVYPHHKDDTVHKSFFIKDEKLADSFVYGPVGQELNAKLNLMIDTYEEEKIPLKDLDKAQKIVEKGIEKTSDKRLRNVLENVIDIIKFAKEKETFIAFWL